jgi:hypothetical protein
MDSQQPAGQGGEFVLAELGVTDSCETCGDDPGLHRLRA